MFFDKLLNALKIENLFSNNDSNVKDRICTADNVQIHNNKSYLSDFTLSDIQQYNGKPFFIDYDLLRYMDFVYIPFSKNNELICVNHLKQLNDLIYPLKKYTQNTMIPENFWCDKNPNTMINNYPSQIRFVPFTPKMKQSKYPVYTFISNMTELYGNQGNQIIYYKKNGEIGKADLYYSKNLDIFFKVQIREKSNILYVRRIDKVYKVETYDSPVPYLKTEIQYIAE